MQHSHRLTSVVVVGSTLLVALSLGACERQPTSPDAATILAAKGGLKGASSESDPTVDAVDPDNAPQDTTLDVRVLGSNYDEGSEVDFLLDGKPTKNIQTQSTRFVSGTELVANITIALDADTVLYDVQVTSLRGRKGIGLERFKVRRKGNPNDPIVTVSSAEPADKSDPSIRLFGDGLGAYIAGFQGVTGSVERQFVFRPQGASSPGKNDEPQRFLCMRFTADQEVTGAGIPRELADDLDDTGRTCATGDIRTVWHENDGAESEGLEGLTAVGQSIKAEARYIWTDGDRNQFKLEFFCADDRDAMACPNLLDVTLIGMTENSKTWRLTFSPSLVAGLSRNNTKGKPTPFEPIAAFHMPFDIVVTKEIVQ